MSQLLDYLGQTNKAFLHAKGETATEHLIQWLDCRAGEKVLEFGIGTGGTLVKVASRYKETKFWGVDASELMINKSENRLKFCRIKNKVSLIKSEDSELTTFDDSFFDKIYVESVLGIQEGDRLRKLFQSFSRILKPNGVLIINGTIWLEETDRKTIAYINNFAKQNFGIIQASSSFPYLPNWVSLMMSNQFTIKQIKGVDKLAATKKYWTVVEILSRFYTLAGAAYGQLIKQHVSRKFKSAMQNLDLQKPVMEGYLIMAVSIK